MTNKNKFVLNQIRQVARENVPQDSLVILFGSRARGETRKNSDWDILIVLPKDHLRQEDYDHRVVVAFLKIIGKNFYA